MFRQRVVFNIVGKKDLVDKACLEIKNIIHQTKNVDASIMMENKDSIMSKVNTNYKDYNFCINKYYMWVDEPKDISNVIDLSRHIRNSSRGTIHPFNLHVDDVDSLYVSDFMKNCSQINCVYPIAASNDVKKKNIEIYLYH